MLAAECAWIILRTEHTRIRELLMLVDAVRRSGDCMQAASRDELIGLIDRLRAFEEATHRPKGVVLLDILRGRSAEADRLLDELALQSERCDALLARARSLLASATDAGPEVDQLLQEHRTLILDHLSREDTLLHSHTALLLSRQEWAVVVSNMSAAMEGARGRVAARRVAADPW